MIPSFKKRFWKTAEVRPAEHGFAVHLDDRQLMTPGKAPLLVPTAELAQEIAQEWLAQSEVVRPERMPATRMANSAIDLVAPQFESVVDMLAEYGGSDLICYRADAPAELVALQAAAWDPLVRWAAAELQAPLTVTTGILPVPQPAASLARLRAAVAGHPPFRLAALHDLVTLSGSAVIGLATSANHLAAGAAWTASRIDEDWQVAQWGADEEAEEARRIKEKQFTFASRFLALLGS